MTTERFARYRFTDKGVCRWCGKPPPKGRRSWCSDACVEEFTVRAWPQKMRQKTLERDRGVCAACGRDCVALEERLRRWLASEPPMAPGQLYRVRPEESPEHARRRLRRCRLAARLGVTDGSAWHPVVRSLWEADHIVPVVEGGGGCGLDNIRTLCRCCHKAETRALAKRRAAARRAQLPLLAMSLLLLALAACPPPSPVPGMSPPVRETSDGGGGCLPGYVQRVEDGQLLCIWTLDRGGDK